MDENTIVEEDETPITPDELIEQKTVDRDERDDLLMHYVCSGCWGTLGFRMTDPGKWLVYCPACGAETHGFVTKRWAEKQRKKDEHDYAEASWNLRSLLAPERETRTQALKDLGF